MSDVLGIIDEQIGTNLDKYTWLDVLPYSFPPYYSLHYES
jgi:hypothetical protein